MARRGGIHITPAQMAAQWRPLPHRFQLNLWNFEVEAGQAAVEVFKESFDLHRLNTNNSAPWRPRRDRKTHPILKETGTLKNSIRYKRTKQAGNDVVRTFTDPRTFGTAARHPGFCYAAVHNDPSGSHTYGNTGVKSIRRQFIGHSTVLNVKLKRLSIKIFEGFPK